jgi:hypothetical protein
MILQEVLGRYNRILLLSYDTDRIENEKKLGRGKDTDIEVMS